MSKAALGTSQWAVDRIRELEEENERLRAEANEAYQVHAEQYEAHRQEGARIEAALAIAKEAVRTDANPAVTVVQMVKALRGEKS